MSVVDLRGVSIIRSGATLVNDVTWRVEEGERWVVIGPNGAGKTTLLQVLGAQWHPSKGTASVLGETLGGLGDHPVRAIADPVAHVDAPPRSASGGSS